MERPVVTLLTDFGSLDPYVGIMKGQILRCCPQAQMVDLTHEVSAHDLRAASFHLQQAVPYFPDGTVHLAVVDPGVGSQRAMVAVLARNGARFVAPDNGLLTRALADAGGAERAVRLKVPEGASSTFHGRDVMAPAAGRWAAGDSLDSLGDPYDLQHTLDFPEAQIEAHSVQAWILVIDRFGNVTFDLGRDQGDHIFEPASRWRCGEREVVFARTYSEVAIGEPLLLWGSQGTLELAVRQGSAAQEFGLSGHQCVTFAR